MDTHASEDDTRPVRYAARQPILAADETVIGYKLLFRNGVVDHFAWKDAEGAGRTAIEISSVLGSNVLCDNRLAFVPCSRDVLVENYLTFLPADKVVAEIGKDVVPDGSVEEACRRLRAGGYRISLESFTLDDARSSLVEFADYLAVDFQHTAGEDILRLARGYGHQNLGLLAQNVENRDQFESGQRAGFHYFQGFFP